MSSTIQYNTVIGHDIKLFTPEISNEQRRSFGVIANGIKLAQENRLDLPKKIIYKSKTQNGQSHIITNCSNWVATDIKFGDVYFFYKTVKRLVTSVVIVNDEVTTAFDDNFIYLNTKSNVMVQYVDENGNAEIYEQEVFPVFINIALTNYASIYNIDEKTFSTERVNGKIKVIYSKPLLLVTNPASDDCLDLTITNKTLSWNQSIFELANQEYDFFRQKFVKHVVRSEMHVINGPKRYLKLDHENIFDTVSISFSDSVEVPEVSTALGSGLTFLKEGILDLETQIGNTDENIYVFVNYEYLKPSNNCLDISQLNNSYNKLSIILNDNSVGYVLESDYQLYLSSNISNITNLPEIDLTETNDELIYKIYDIESYEPVSQNEFFYNNAIDEFTSIAVDMAQANNADYIGTIEFYAKQEGNIDLVTFQRSATLLDNVYEHNVVEKYAESIVVFGEIDPLILPFNFDTVAFDTDIKLQTDILSETTLAVDIADILSVIDMPFTIVADRNEQYFAIRNYADSQVCSEVSTSFSDNLTLVVDGDELVLNGYIVPEDNKIILVSTTNLMNSTIVEVSFSGAFVEVSFSGEH